MAEYVKKSDVLELWKYWKHIEAYDKTKALPPADVVPTDFHDKTVEAITDKYIKEFQRMAKEFDEATERKKGEWITEWVYEDEEDEESGYWKLKCSACGKSRFYDMTKYPFCPNCGADMRGEDNETN